MARIKVSKLAAVRQQLDVAIELYFTTDNAIATHTLAAAAYNALKDIAKKEGAEHPYIKNGYVQSLPEVEKKAILKHLNEAENFFKHADRDSQAEIEFDSDLTEILLTDACAYFKSANIERPRYYSALIAWAGDIKEEIARDSPEYVLIASFRDFAKAKGKKEFWALFSSRLSGK